MNDPGSHGPSSSDARLRVPLSTGTHIDHYVIHSVLGSGGFGITYLANHDLLGKYYAIKEYFPSEFSYREGKSVRPTTTSGPTYRWGLDRFLSEARALARFKHAAEIITGVHGAVLHGSVERRQSFLRPPRFERAQAVLQNCLRRPRCAKRQPCQDGNRNNVP